MVAVCQPVLNDYLIWSDVVAPFDFKVYLKACLPKPDYNLAPKHREAGQRWYKNSCNDLQSTTLFIFSLLKHLCYSSF